MDEWLFWEQYSHEPYVAVCRFQMIYLGKPASDLDPDKVKRGYAALARMEHQLAVDAVSGRRQPSRSPTSRCWPIRGSRMKAAFTSTAMPRCAAGSGRPKVPRAAVGALVSRNVHGCRSTVTIRRARLDDVGAIVAMLADDPLGGARERIEDPLPPSYFRAFEAVDTRSEYSARGRGKRAAPWSAACSSASCRA